MAEAMVQALLHFSPRQDGDDERWLYDPGPDVKRRPVELDSRTVPIHNARAEGLEADLDREGFENIRCDADIAFNTDPKVVRRSFYPAIEKLVQKRLGARRILVFDHDFRTTEVGQQTEHLRSAVLNAHNDYTEKSGPQRVRDLLPDEAEELLKRRFSFINVWKPISYPAEDTPLAVCDVRTLGPRDLVTMHLHYQHRIGEIYGLRYNPSQRWYYYPNMRIDEALLLKVYDSDRSVARFMPHSAFKDPSTRADAPARRSIEVRTIAFF